MDFRFLNFESRDRGKVAYNGEWMMERRHFGGSYIHPFLLFVLFITSIVGDDCEIGGPSTLAEAIKTCNGSRGRVANRNESMELVQRMSDCGGEEINATDIVITSDIVHYTPLLTTQGCYRAVDSVADENHTISSCCNHCHESKAFAISDTICRCLPSKVNLGTPQNTKLCRSNNNNYMELYSASNSTIGLGYKELNEYFMLIECRILGGIRSVRRLLRRKSEIDSLLFYPACRSVDRRTLFPISTAYDTWELARDACANTGGGDLIQNLTVNDCNYLSTKMDNVYISVTFWSGLRSYRNVAKAYDNEVKANHISKSYTKCMAVTKGNSKEIPCSTEYYFFCIIDKKEFVALAVASAFAVIFALGVGLIFYKRHKGRYRAGCIKQNNIKQLDDTLMEQQTFLSENSISSYETAYNVLSSLNDNDAKSAEQKNPEDNLQNLNNSQRHDDGQNTGISVNGDESNEHEVHNNGTEQRDNSQQSGNSVKSSYTNLANDEDAVNTMNDESKNMDIYRIEQHEQENENSSGDDLQRSYSSANSINNGLARDEEGEVNSINGKNNNTADSTTHAAHNANVNSTEQDKDIENEENFESDDKAVDGKDKVGFESNATGMTLGLSIMLNPINK